MPTLHECGIALTLPEIVALYDAGLIAALLPPPKDQVCNWCLEPGTVWETGYESISSICPKCLSEGVELMRAQIAGNADAIAFWKYKINSRQRVADEAIH